MRTAQFDPPQNAIPDGLHARAVGMRATGEVVATGVVDDKLQLMPSRRQRLSRNGIDVRRGERIAIPYRLAVPERLALPHHALKEQLHRLAAVRRLQLDRARPDRLPLILPFLDECLGLLEIHRRLEIMLRPALAEMRRGKRARQLRLGGEAPTRHLPNTIQRDIRANRTNRHKGASTRKNYFFHGTYGTTGTLVLSSARPRRHSAIHLRADLDDGVSLHVGHDKPREGEAENGGRMGNGSVAA